MSAIAQMGPVTEMRPAFTVTPTRRKMVKNIAKFDRELRKSEVTPIEVEVDGYMVRCYRGHEMFIDSLAELRRLGFTGDVPMIGKVGTSDEEMIVGAMPSMLNAEKVA